VNPPAAAVLVSTPVGVPPEIEVMVETLTGVLVGVGVRVLVGALVLVTTGPLDVELGPAEAEVAVGVRVLVGAVVFVATGPLDVELGPAEAEVAVGVRVLVGAVVLVGTGPPDVGLGPAKVEVAVEGAVDVLVGTAGWVAVARGVFVAGGASTSKEPSEPLTGTGLPPGSLAAALLNVSDDVPGVAPASTLKLTTATAPSGITA
jgi:hypothetical protein